MTDKQQLKSLLNNYEMTQTNQEISAITDWNELEQIWDNAFSDSVPRQQIEARMGQILLDVTIANTPEWFIYLLEYPADCPDKVKPILDQQVQKLKTELAED